MGRALRKLLVALVVLAVAAAGIGAVTSREARAASKPTVEVTRASTGKLTMRKGASYKLGSKASKGAKLTYKSSKPSVVSVSKKGALKARGTGSATITVTAKSGKSKVTKKVKVTVVTASKFKKVKAVKVTPAKRTLNVGGSVQLKATLTPKKASNKNLIYKSSNAKVATVSAKGKVVARAAGTAKVTVTSADNAKAKKVVTITVAKAPTPAQPTPAQPTPAQPSDPAQPTQPAGDVEEDPVPTVGVTSVELSECSAQLVAGESLALTATTYPAEATDQSIAWSTSNEDVVTVVDGVVTANNPGSATVSATAASGAVADCVVYVESVDAAAYAERIEACKAMVEQYGWDDQVQSLDVVQGDPYYSGRLIVQTDGDGVDLSAVSPQPLACESDGEGMTLVQFASSADAQAAADVISNMDNVRSVEPDVYVEFAGGTDADAAALDSLGQELEMQSGQLSWGTSAIGADDLARSLARRKGSVVVAVIDSGVDTSHPFLQGRIAPGAYNTVGVNSENQVDEEGHGTHVAGIVVDATPGLSNIKVLPVKVLGETIGPAYAVAQGVRYAVKHGAQVINMSLESDLYWVTNPGVIDAAVDDAVSKGVVVVAAAGNRGGRTDDVTPGRVMSAMVVGAVDESLDRWSASNIGGSLDFVAPGVSITSSVPIDVFNSWYHTAEGTSQAAPYIAAAAAMIKLKYPAYTPGEVEGVLRDCAQDLGSPGRDDEFGYGIPRLSKISGDTTYADPTTPEIDDITCKTSLDQYTWDELKVIANAIAAAPSYNDGLAIAAAYDLTTADGKLTGETKPVEVEGLGTANVRIAGFRHDDKTSGGKAGITFEFANTVGTHVMNSTETNSGGWASSEIRSYLNDEYLQLLPAGLTNNIALVHKSANNVGETYDSSLENANVNDTTCVSTTDDKLWLLSMSEVYGELSSYSSNVPWSPATYDAEGTQYQLYADQGVTSSSYSYARKSGSSSSWWLRSPDPDSSDHFHDVSYDGDWRDIYAGDADGVSPGFCF